ncbi:hypothetical protein SAMN04488564_111104 [Lentzea waywayandensis]|uniref:DUF4760 domain-containing protein n=1 Tax=Lentzea waywayandensis TaxID=84724 RepID=A0A1I6FC41_9PSEU|nr:hypothetical protein [Lentzea waywayandensis]SFR27555.1 hypothetical protein SAMN04488564_111104 [Lentzea waywayandensis]
MITYWLAPTATIFAAIVAAFIAYRNNIRLHEAQERLKWINAQLAEFYGPLYSISEASNVAWVQFRKLVRPEGGYLFDYDLSEEEQKEWISWMTNVFMPANKRMYEIIVTRSHLLVGETIPEVYAQFCAHMATYEVVVYRWSQGDVSVLNSPIQFPDGFRTNIAESFLHLKRQQQELLLRVQPSRRWFKANGK